MYPRSFAAAASVCALVSSVACAGHIAGDTNLVDGGGTNLPGSDSPGADDLPGTGSAGAANTVNPGGGIGPVSSDNLGQGNATGGSGNAPLGGIGAPLGGVSAPLTTGVGYLASAYDPSACLDHPNQKAADGAYLMQLYSCNYTTTQSLQITADGSVVDTDHKRCLQGNVLGGNSPSLVSMGACDSTLLRQKWDVTNRTLRHRQTGKCLDLVKSSSSNGALLALTACNGSDTQNWSGPTPLSVPIPDPLAAATTVAGKCAPKLIVENAIDDANNKRWLAYFPDVAAMVQTAINNDCNVMFASAADVPTHRAYLKIVPEWSIEAAAYVSGREVHMSASYLVASASAGNSREGIGVLHHEMTHFYQVNNFGAPVWLIEGMADFVRYRTGYIPLSNRKKGGAYTDSYQVTGFFLDYLERQYPGIMRRLARDLWQKEGGWDDVWFDNQTGKNVASLWAAYQATL